MEFTRDDCVASLLGIQARLETFYDLVWEPGGRRPRRWKTDAGDLVDLAGTIDACCDENRLPDALQWIEFNLDSGVARRDRLAKILRLLRAAISKIETGDDRDPFLWARKSIDSAAGSIPLKAHGVARYIQETIRLIEPDLTPIEARNKFCFDEWQAGQSYKEINVALHHHSEWEAFEDDLAVRSAIHSWGKRIGQSPRRGQPGRRAKA